MAERFDAVVVGAGIVGLATARALAIGHRRRVVVVEMEPQVAFHQTGHNSGVIHSGLYYRPGSVKATHCARGREALYRYCGEAGIRHERCGKLVVAISPQEIARLDELERRGKANGLAGIRRLDAAEIREREPHVAGVAGLLVPETGIVDYVGVAAAMATEVEARGGEVRLGSRCLAVRRYPGEVVVETSRGAVAADGLVNCAGLQSDRVARLCGVDPGVRIVPFRGDYYVLAEERRSLVRHLIYPVPDPELPFLGVHFTRRVDGSVEAGPNAVLAWRREGYSRASFSWRDAWSTLSFPGLWRMAPGYAGIGWQEYRRAWSRTLFVESLRRLIPEIEPADVRPGGAGVRAQALDRSGRLLDDFHLVDAERMVHVLNAPSPAATAALAIGETVAERAMASFGRVSAGAA